MFWFIKSLFNRDSKNLLAVIDIWSFLVKTIIVDKKSSKIVSTWESAQNYYAMRSWNINDLKSVISRVGQSLDNAENKINKSVWEIAFWLSADNDYFRQQNFRAYIQTISDELGGKFIWFYCLPSVYSVMSYKKPNYLIVDIWSSNTSVSLVKNWLFRKAESFSIWWSLFTARISKIFALSKTDSEKIKFLFCWWSSSPSCALSDEDFKYDIDLWLTAFWVALKNFEEKLPRFVLLTWWWSIFPLLKDSLRNRNLPYKKLWFEERPEFDMLLDAWLKLNKWKKIENIVPWVPVRMLAEFLMKHVIDNKSIK